MLLLLKYPDPILNQKSEDCVKSDLPLIKQNFDEMVKIMDKAEGVGLAAVQVGILKRYCIIKSFTGESNLIINPVITEGLDLEKKLEGCLSLPLFSEHIQRFNEVTVTYRDENWIERTAVFTGLQAQAIQHEINHFNGLLLINTVSLMKEQMWKKKLKKRGLL